MSNDERSEQGARRVADKVAAGVAVRLRGTGLRGPSADRYRFVMENDGTRQARDLTVDHQLTPDVVVPIQLPSGWPFYNENVKQAAERLAAGIVGAEERKGRLIARLERMRERVAPLVERVGGVVRLVDFGFAPIDCADPIDMRDLEFTLEYERLDEHLALERGRLSCRSVRSFASSLAFDARCQRRLAKQRDRLAAAGAVAELSALGEAAIAQSGQRLGDVLRRLQEGERTVHLQGEYAPGADTRLSVYQFDGWIHAAGCISTAPLRVATHSGELRIDDPIDADRLRALTGRPGTDLVDIPVLRIARRIASSQNLGGSVQVVLRGMRSRLVREDEMRDQAAAARAAP